MVDCDHMYYAAACCMSVRSSQTCSSFLILGSSSETAGELGRVCGGFEDFFSKGVELSSVSGFDLCTANLSERFLKFTCASTMDDDWGTLLHLFPWTENKITFCRSIILRVCLFFLFPLFFVSVIVQ